MARKILVVDDEADLEPLILQKFRKRVRSGELEFFFARNGQQALEVLSQDEGIAIVFSDINMPVMDGLTFLSRVTSFTRPLKTIMVSAYDDLQNIRTAMNRGAFDFLTKPIDFQDFEHTLTKTEGELAVMQESLQNKERLFLLQNELALAGRIQKSILPTEFPVHPRFEIYARMSPARGVSGDFYDFFWLDETFLAFAIGDVSGKGIPAAIYMAVCRTLLRGAASLGAPPEECLRTVNDILLRQGNAEMYVTAFYGVLDTVGGLISYAVAGQTPPYVIRANSTIESLAHVGGTMIGLLEEPTIGAGEVKLNAGDTIVLTTDGICDAENVLAEPFAQQRLESALEWEPSSAQAIVERIFLAVDGFCKDAARFDDITALALQLRPK